MSCKALRRIAALTPARIYVLQLQYCQGVLDCWPEEQAKIVHHVLEMSSKRNDGWLNSHMEPIMKVWRSNFDLQLTIDLGKVVGYIIKYVNMTEAKMSWKNQRLLQAILTKTVDRESVCCWCPQMHHGAADGRKDPVQAGSCHLIMDQLTIYCLHSFMTVNQKNNTRRIMLWSNTNTSNNNPADPPAVTKLTIIDAYACRMEKTRWVKGDAYEEVKESLSNMSQWFLQSPSCGKQKCKQKQNQVEGGVPKKSGCLLTWSLQL